MITEQIDALLQEVANLTAGSADEVEQLRIKYLSRKGILNALMAEFRNVAPEEKKAVGMRLNELKQAALTKINGLRDELDAHSGASDDIDLTCTSYPVALGTRHPLSIVRNEIINIFSRMGFTLADGPEVDDDKHVFTMLNFAADHPARDMQDTLYIADNILLRTQTSSGQARVMLNKKPPLKIISPGKVYRADDDATHSPMFHQMEGLVVDKDINLCDLKGTLEAFLKKLFVYSSAFNSP